MQKKLIFSTYKLKEFSFTDKFNRPTNFLIIGNRNTGKTTFIKEIILNIYRQHNENIDFTVIFSPIKNSNLMDCFDNNTNVYYKVDLQVLDEIYNKQLHILEKHPNQIKPIIIIFDECYIDNQLENNGYFNDLLLRHQELNIYIIMSINTTNSLHNHMRSYFNYFFICKDTSDITKKNIYDQYGKIIHDFMIYDNIINSLESYQMLVIKNFLLSSDIFDNIFWHQTNINMPLPHKPIPTFKKLNIENKKNILNQIKINELKIKELILLNEELLKSIIPHID